MGADEIYLCLVENADFVVYQIDAQGLISYVSSSIEIYSGYKVEEFIGRSFTRFIHPEDICEVMVRFRDAAAGISGFSEFRGIHKNGSVLWIRASSRPPAGAHPSGVIGIMTDITERRQAEQALRESEDRYRDLAENSQDLLCMHDLQGKLLWINQAPAHALGYSVEEMVGNLSAISWTLRITRNWMNIWSESRETRWPNRILQFLLAGASNVCGNVITLCGQKVLLHRLCAVWRAISPSESGPSNN